MIVAGIDPGKSGALAIDYGDGSVFLWDVPMVLIKGKAKPAWTEWGTSWRSALEFANPDLIVIENVAAMPGQGVTSMFTFGRTLGFAHSIAITANCRIEFVTPAVWMAKMGLLGASKDASREKFRTLFPAAASQVTRIKDHGRAEAGMLAVYGRKFLS